MDLPTYFADVAKVMRLRSAAIRRDFASHRPTAGKNREDLVQAFLIDHLPAQFLVTSGLLIDNKGYFSNQADLMIVDHLRNAPLHGSGAEKLWPVESAYALFEVKTLLSPSEIEDAVAKCRRFKTLNREFLEVPDGERQRLKSSLFVLWAYDSPKAETVRSNLLTALSGVPRSEQPDFVVVPSMLVASGGEYLELGRIGQPDSLFRQQLHEKHGPDLSMLLPDPFDLYDLGENSLAAWYVWLDSWLRRAGPRLNDPVTYLPAEKTWGRVVR